MNISVGIKADIKLFSILFFTAIYGVKGDKIH